MRNAFLLLLLQTLSFPIANHPRWVSGNGGVLGNVFRDDTSGADSSAFTNCDTAQERNTGTNRRPPFYQRRLARPVSFGLKLATSTRSAGVSVVNESDSMPNENL